jgi:hypothetical protein
MAPSLANDDRAFDSLLRPGKKQAGYGFGATGAKPAPSLRFAGGV